MLLTYLAYQSYHWIQRRNKKLREKMIREQENRFTEQRRELQKQLDYIEVSAAAKKEK